MRLLGQLLPVLIAGAGVAYRLPAWWQGARDRALDAYMLTLITFAAAWVILYPPVAVALAQTTGMPNVSRPFGNGITLVSGFLAQAYFVLQRGEAAAIVRRKLAWRAAGTAGAITLMVWLFTLAPVSQEAATDGFLDRYATEPAVAAYRLTYLIWFGLEMFWVVVLSAQFARKTNRPRMTAGLWLISAGGHGGLLYAAGDGAYLAVRWLAVEPPVSLDDARVWLLVAVSAMMVFGSILPALTPRVSPAVLRRWVWQQRTSRRLTPLHQALMAAMRPQPAAAAADQAAGWRIRLPPRAQSLRLQRQVVEISDALGQLEPHLDPNVAAMARRLAEQAGLTGEALAATVHAAGVAAALQTYTAAHHQQPPAPTGEVTFGAPDPSPRALATDRYDLAAQLVHEVARLMPLADAYATSPVVRAALRHNPPTMYPARCGDQPS